MLESYHFILISLLVIILYFSTYLLVQFNKIKLLTHRKIWNFVLLFSFLLSGILGLLLAFLIDMKMSIDWYREFLWIHVETGIIMAIISIFHAFWHIKYYVNFKKNENNK